MYKASETLEGNSSAHHRVFMDLLKNKHTLKVGSSVNGGNR